MENMKFAVLIDCENISYRYVDIIMDELAKEGTITYRRIYGDWSDSKTRGWKEKLLENSIIPIQSFPYTSGKNSTDTTMVIDAMDILYTGKVDGFCLVSSDCDFTRLASRLKEAGMKVIGMGEQKTPPAFVTMALKNYQHYLSIWALKLIKIKCGLNKRGGLSALPYLELPTAAVFVFFTTATRTRIITPNLWRCAFYSSVLSLRL